NACAGVKGAVNLPMEIAAKKKTWCLGVLVANLQF
ncbi:MAG: hypothetical protein QG657_4474, partial [Acidobacteriota bacterium]|nr:hypothetical protein [Acidobacteriota bacterium]